MDRLPSLCEATHGADSLAVLRGDDFCDASRCERHPRSCFRVFCASFKFPHGDDTEMARWLGAVLDAGDPDAVLPLLAAAGVLCATKLARSAVSCLRCHRSAVAVDLRTWFSANLSCRGDHQLGDGLLRHRCAACVGDGERHARRRQTAQARRMARADWLCRAVHSQ